MKMLLALKMSLTALFLLMAQTVVATANEQRGRQIFLDAERFHAGYGTMSSRGKMVLSGPNGNNGTREFLSFLNEIGSNEIRSLMEFTTPQEINGTRLLTHAFDNSRDRQWLYLPSLERTRRIAGATRSNAFLGSEFSFEDLSDITIDDFRFNWVAQTECPGRLAPSRICEVVDRFPLVGGTAYSYVRTYIDTQTYYIHRSEYYDRNNRLFKIMDVRSYQIVNGIFHRINDMTMSNQLTQRRTRIQVGGFQIGQPLSGSLFNPQRLDR